jgi:2-oxoisovalerate dehydrogenase E1 component
MTLLTERTEIPAARVAAKDSFIATGPAYAATLPSADEIHRAARKLMASVQ